MTQDFVEEKDLEFVKAADIGDFWGGGDSCGEHLYELFITADEAGPTPVQIERYYSLCEKFDEIYNSIVEKYHSHPAVMEGGRGDKWQNVPLRILFVNVHDDSKAYEIERPARNRGFLMFARTLNFVAGLRGNRLVSSRPSENRTAHLNIEPPAEYLRSSQRR
jgi:hypothetical protein